MSLSQHQTVIRDKSHFQVTGADGSAGQFLKTDGSGALSFAINGKVVGLSIVNSTTNEQNTSGGQTWTLVGLN